MTVLGIDYDSERVYLVLVDENTGQYVSEWTCRLDCGPGDALARARRVRRLMPTRTRLEAYGVTSAAIELPYSKFPGSLVPLMRVQGAVLACLPDGLEVTEYRPQTWKRLSVGKSNAGKPAIRAWALDQGVPDGLSQDTYDAYGIARAHLAALDQRAAA